MSEEAKSLITLLGLIFLSASVFVVVLLIIVDLYEKHEAQNKSD